MTNCEDCVYYEYDPERIPITARRIWMRMRWSGSSVPPMTAAPFTAPVTSTGRPGGSKGPDRESRDGVPAFPLAEAEGEAFPLRR